MRALMKPGPVRWLVWGFWLALSLAGHSAWAALDINQASPADLQAIRGIGPAMSQRILETRAVSRFADWTDLITRVRGAGPSTAAKWSAQGLTVNGQPYESARSETPQAAPPVWRRMEPAPLVPLPATRMP